MPSPHRDCSRRKAASEPLRLLAVAAAQDTPLTPRERTLQLLNRFTYGPRPGQVDQVLAQGPDKWLEQQLAPASIPDKTLDRRLADYPTLSLKPDQVLNIFPDRGAIQQIAEGKRPYPADPLEASVYEVAVSKLLAEQDEKKHPYVELTRPAEGCS